MISTRPFYSGPGPSIFLVDDEPRVRDGFKNLLLSMGCSISGEAGSGGEALAHECLSGSGLVLLDLSLGDDDGLDLIAPLRGLGFPVLVCSLHDGAHMVRRALEAGANGYVTKREAASHLFHSVQAVVSGNPYLSPRAAAALERNPI